MTDTLNMLNSSIVDGRDWIAIIVGLAAWLPWIVIFISKYLVKPKIQLTSLRRILTINNSDNAPYISIALSIFSFRRNASIYKIKMELKNCDTEEIRKYDCYAINDVAIRSIVGKDGTVNSIAIFSFGGIVV
jgi:hypothetical protein